MTRAQLFVDRADVRQAERRQAEMPATVRADLREPIDVKVLNLSATGVAIETSRALPVGSTFHIGIAGVPLQQARVAREMAHGYGCEFIRPITEADVERAGVENTVLFPGERLPAPPYPDPVIQLWPRRTRMTLAIAGAALAWAVTIGIAAVVM